MINFSASLTLVVAALIGAFAFEMIPALTGDARLVAAAMIVFATSILAESAGFAPRVLQWSRSSTRAAASAASSPAASARWTSAASTPPTIRRDRDALARKDEALRQLSAMRGR